jgi:hypothetical protein
MSFGFPDEVDEAAWTAHELAINRCRGGVCYDAIVGFFAARDGIRYGKNKLEVLCGFVKNRADARGTIRSWVDRGVEPSRALIAAVKRATGGIVDLAKVVDHPLWDLLRRKSPSLPWLNRALELRSAAVREVLYLEADRAGRFSHHTPDRQTTLTLRDLGGLDAFTAMLILARRGEWEEHDPSHALPSMCAFDMFPRMIVSEATLKCRWEDLADCMVRMYWRRIYRGGAIYSPPLSRLPLRIVRLQANPRAKFRCFSGRRLSRQKELAMRREELEYEAKRLNDERKSRRREREQWRRLQAASERLFGPGNGITFLEDGMPDPPDPEWEPVGDAAAQGGESEISAQDVHPT